MSTRFISIDRETPMLLPPDLRDWVPEKHLVHFVVDAVESLSVVGFKVNHRGTGDAQYPPVMMLSLLIYCYATGRFSSRDIEAASHIDVAVRYICGNRHPDHDTICAFRRENGKAQYNFTDPASRIMKAGSGNHFEQSYNAQAAVDIEGSMLVLGQRVAGGTVIEGMC